MRRTVDSPDTARRKRLYWGLFFLGIVLLMAAVVLFFPALEYEFREGEPGEVDQVETATMEYEHLTPQEQRVVDGAIEGETYTLEDSSPLPGTPQFSFQPRQLQVTKDGTTHTFIYEAVFPVTSLLGFATIALAVSGLVAIFEAVRRHDFQHAWPWQHT